MNSLKITAAVVLAVAAMAVFWYKNRPPTCADPAIQEMIAQAAQEEMRVEFGADKVPASLMLFNIVTQEENSQEGSCRCSADFFMDVPKSRSRWSVQYSLRKVSLLGQYDVSINIKDPARE